MASNPLSFHADSSWAPIQCSPRLERLAAATCSGHVRANLGEGYMSRITTASVAASARGLAAILAALLVVASLGGASTSVAQEAATAPATAEPSAAPQPISKEKIDQLVAPIALYPDNLLGQILAASTYPLEV